MTVSKFTANHGLCRKLTPNMICTIKFPCITTVCYQAQSLVITVSCVVIEKTCLHSLLYYRDIPVPTGTMKLDRFENLCSYFSIFSGDGGPSGSVCLRSSQSCMSKRHVLMLHCTTQLEKLLVSALSGLDALPTKTSTDLLTFLCFKCACVGGGRENVCEISDG